MAGELPPELSALLDGKDPASRDEAWSVFLERHSRLLLKAARTFGPDYDASMDRYRFIVEALRKDDFRRLRSYQVHGRSSFRSWLTVVARRLCLDHERVRYGRGGRAADASGSEKERSARRRLVDLVGTDLDPGLLPYPSSSNPERELRSAELGDALTAVIGALDPSDRLLLKLRFEDDLAVRQIAEVMSYPSVFHVYRHLKSLLGEIRGQLISKGVAGPAP